MALVGSVDSTKVQLHPNDSFSSQGTTVVDVSTARLERIITKQLTNVQRGISRTRYVNGPKNIIHDYLKVAHVFRLKGVYKHSTTPTWANCKTFMDNLITIFEGGGTFYLAWRAADSSEAHEVNLQQVQFVSLGGEEHKIEYTIDLMKGEKRP